MVSAAPRPSLRSGTCHPAAQRIIGLITFSTRGSSRTRKFEILARLVNFCWFFFKWGLALGLVAAAVCAVPYFYRHVDDTIRTYVETLVAEHYPELDVSVRAAELVEGGILIRGLSIVQRGADGPRAELAYLDEMLLVCETDLPTLLRSTPKIREIVVRRPTIRNTRRPDGTWSAARLLPLPKFGEQTPDINIEGATLELFDPLKNPTGNLTLREGHLKVTPAKAADLAATATVAANNVSGKSVAGNAAAGAKASGASASDARRPMSIRGSFAGDHMQRIEIDGAFDPTAGTWDVGGKLEGLEISPELVHALPGGMPPQLKLLESLRGQAKGDFHVRYAASEEQKLTFQVTGQLIRGRVDDPRLPYPLTDLRASFRCDERGFAVDDMTANSGPATLRLDFERDGYGENRPLVLAGEARHLKIDPQLNPQLLEMFPPSWREKWFEFAPSGEIDLDVKLAYDGRTWQPDVKVQCHGVDFCYFKFPYRLEHGIGEVTLKHDAARKSNVLTVGVTALSGNVEVRIDGAMHRPGRDWDGHLEVRSNNLPVDKKLLDALPPKPREVVGSLHPSNGNINVLVRYSRDALPNARLDRYIKVDVNTGSIKYERFPYPLSDVRGTLEIRNDIWSFKDFVGANHTARIHCSGDLKPAAGGNELVLKFTGDDVPLEEELRDALAPAARRLWNDVRPRGLIHLNAEVRHHLARKQTLIWVGAEPLGDTASIEPIQFPLRLDKVRGVFTYNNGHLDMQDLRAEHGQDMRVSGRGICDIDPQGGWRLRLENVSAGRLRADRDLLQALPPRLRKAVTKLNLTGPLHMNGAIELASSGQPDTPLRSSWNLDFDLQQVGLHCGVPIDNINGKVNLAGEFDGQKFRSRGEMAIDSLTYKDFQFTEARGPFSISDQQVVFGEWASPVGQPKRHITTRIFGGFVVGDGWATFEEAPRYNLYAKLTAADLARCAQEFAPGARRLKGKVEATVNLHGQGAGINQLAGRGAIRLTDADVYELPVMAQLLKIVSARAPDANAFDKSDIDFTIRGEHVYFPRIDFNGDAISLRGTGEMGLDKNIRLEFYTVLGRDEFRIPFVSDVFGGASQGLLKIYVGGTLADPKVRKQALPMLTEPLQQIQAELQRSRGATGAAATGSRPLPSPGSLTPQRR